VSCIVKTSVDANCVKLCEAYGFDCYDYRHPGASTLDSTVGGTPTDLQMSVGAHVMEQVSTVKLYYLSKLLARGVNVLLLDLDVGFLRDPALLYAE
jgi:hypothetical protein